MRFPSFYRRGCLPLIPFAALLLMAPPGLESAPPSKPCRPKPCKWKYIVVHHSATRKGNAAIMDKYHSSHRHMQNGLAYHFVIDNGTSGRGDGEIEEGYRWRAQLPGGHAKQPWLNESGIGICLVGNFNWQTVSKKQMDSLATLVNRLRNTYGIPLDSIKGHGDFKGEHTMCPGFRFPMRRFKDILVKRDVPSASKTFMAGGKAKAAAPAASNPAGRIPAPGVSNRSPRNARRSVS